MADALTGSRLSPQPVWRRLALLAVAVARIVLLLSAVIILSGAHFLGISAEYRWGTSLLASILALMACWRRGGGLAWVMLIAGLTLFLEIRAVADNAGFPVHTEDVRRLEQFLFGGVFPTHALQAMLFDPSRFHVLDYFSVLVHGSYFLFPYLALMAVWAHRPKEAHRLAGLLTAIFLLSLVIYTLMPATPPWLASARHGAPTVYRIVYFVGRPMGPDVYDRVTQSIADPNPIAALPSVHFAVTFALLVYPLARRSRWAWAGAVYSVAMLWSLVYLGEHYVVDCLLGAAVTVSAWWLYGRVHRALAEPRQHST